MNSDFLSRLVGMVVFAIIGTRLGAAPGVSQSINFSLETSAFLFGMIGLLFGLILTPWFTVRPIRWIRQLVSEEPIEKVLLSLLGMLLGFIFALLVAYPLSLLDMPFGNWLPTAFAVVAAYLGLTMFNYRSKELSEIIAARFGRQATRTVGVSSRKLVIDTSSLIDGRIVDVAETGFLGGTLIVPHFVLNELHKVADSSDALRRGRGRRGLQMLNKLQRSELVPVRIVEEDFEEIAEVDDKLVALSLEINAMLITNDYNLSEVAEAQGVKVLNINVLANAVRAIYIPGESFAIRVIQEGTDQNQGVGYLDDGTMVVIENGKSFMDRTITVEVTKLINRNTGRIIFAKPV